ncbi:arf-GAP with Rho-GAP domain, ANK repeat and PH domain-containing protein 2 isoform X1 [Phyllostomus hastatus]|uniref:arf-GAP with Rho-GAP domain, ANK repeat and PH domain-containing protein 2 isoform X1 n=1 Tax=Phyllostomus hastatus TaxID=9423 RepID=UPI001E682E94|nr:arf-GAP with Rho-GAP domain, ANK repeat and PH domain-containing protein 2 isoform X1 [Phyllostomus hastatus]XP_045690377.1 arf-GAP with Rho-GAP domain, ANK repeat and PH domain-containing protein 2 isoform X1 [Phyllostomus hastatus]XP_045690378.1 arf-GAP with Rho-GAP domain, ANK repeat and PH domain-containing protein 2 isoform X1 [Phyllostomus hastatus]XP_045690379.1 arf-GAP with Rho-GAP domain, ANK repeat and PH domain-containing protein 2 isoform X1 [Phyllostomus hastatus]XP_045690380.1 
MSSATAVNVDIKDFLMSINLEQYLSLFREFGFNTVKDCATINDSVLHKIGISPTGHRRRIIKQLQIILSKMQDIPIYANIHKTKKNGETSKDHPAPSSDKGTCTELLDSCTVQTLKPVQLETVTKHLDQHDINVENSGSHNSDGKPSLPEHSLPIPGGEPRLNLDSCQYSLPGSENSKIESLATKKTVDCTVGEEQAGNADLISDNVSRLPRGDPECLPARGCPLSEADSGNGTNGLSGSSPPSPFFKFQGEMVVNDLYVPSSPFLPPMRSRSKLVSRPSRSFMLRHRPVPEIPGSTKGISGSYFRERRNVATSTGKSATQHNSNEENSSSIFPYGETFLFQGLETSKKKCIKNEFWTHEDTLKGETATERNSFLVKSSIYDNRKENVSEDKVEDIWIPRKDTNNCPTDCASDSEYSTVEECFQSLRRKNSKASKSRTQKASNLDPVNRHSYPLSSTSGNADSSTISSNAISPYACFYGSSARKVKSGWLDKLCPQGKRMFQKRWVKFDGHSISYYNNEKEKYSKGMIPLSAISTVRVQGDNKFEVVTTQRTFVFRVEKEEERNDWMSILLNALKSQSPSQSQTVAPPDKCGYLELRGYKAKIFTVLSGNSVWLCKNEQDFKSGLGITTIPMNVANVKQVDRTVKQSFEIITPYKSFSFIAESVKEKQEWIEAVQQSIAETLSDYEVAEKIWFNESNRSCADCKAPDPDWASINLCVVICKKCAGQHRSLGPKDSKVRSLKMDASIWSNELIELFIVIGNKRANDFWAGNLQKDEELHMDSPVEKRKTFITQKYKEGRFRKTLLASLSKEELNKALCAAVVKSDVLETMALLFSGADAMCATGDPVHSTPYLLAKKAGQSLQMEFLYHNKFSDFPQHDIHFEGGLSQESSQSTFLCDFLYQAPSAAPKLSVEKKLLEETNKKWCVLEGGFLSYYENDKSATPNGTININEVICLAVHKEDFYLNTGPIFTFEIYLPSERVFLFGAETSDSQRKWTEAIAKHFVPFVAENLTKADYDLIGQLYYKDCQALDQWKKGWFAMDKSSLHFCLPVQEVQEDRMNLRRLQELTISTMVQNGEKVDILLLVEKGRTLYIHGHTKLDFTVWHTAIEKAAGTDGNALQDQQLSKNDVPIIVNSCIAFVTQYGLGCKYIYQKNGDSLRVCELLESFKKDARSFKLRAGKHQLEDVTGVLKRFLADIDDALLTKELYPYWISALDTQDDKERIKKYGTFIRSLSGVNRATLAAIIEHLYRVQKCSEINHMNAHNLALVFSSYLFQTRGQTSEEVNVIEDLINNYVEIFEVKEDQVKQMDIENSFITKWKDTQVSQAGDLLIEVYVERKEPDCSNIIRISPVMEAEELTNDILAIKNIIPTKGEIWATFEVIENEELERPLHYTENVLEQVLRWSSLADPGSAYLVVKRFLTIDTVKHYNERMALGSIKEGTLKVKEEPSKILSGNKFQDRYSVLRDGYLFLYKDQKSSKPDKMFSLSSMKFYLGVKKKMKPPTSWGLTAYSEKHHWHLCCDSSQTQMEWMASVFIAQHEHDVRPPAGKERKRSITKNPKIGGLPLIPIQHERNATEARRNIESARAELEKLRLREKGDQESGDSTLKERASMVAHCLEHRDDKLRSRTRKHRSFNCLEDTEAEAFLGQQRCLKGFKNSGKAEDRNGKAPLDPDNKLPSKVIEELSVVLQRSRTLPKELQGEQVLQKDIK